MRGTSLDGKQITCIDCVGSSQGRTTREGDAIYAYAHLFPHFVVIGDVHIAPAANLIRSIRFTVGDASSLFYDFDAFGFVIDTSPLIDALLTERRKLRAVEAGEWPQVAYFTGKFTVVEVDTAIGKLSVQHRPTSNMGGPGGFYMKNQMFITIDPSSPIAFEEAIDRTASVCRFLSTLAGRQQGVESISLTTGRPGEGRRQPLQVHWSYAPKGARSKDSQNKPEPGDVPLDPVRRQEEFAIVTKNWIARDGGWRIARNRYLSCLKKGNAYSVDRLVAAANMFDVLPLDAVPLPRTLPDDLAEFQSVCLDTLRKLPQSLDRDSAISAIARMGSPSLPKKVMFRAKMVERQVGSRFPDLSYVLKLAIACRNHFVHGGSDRFDFEAAEPFLPLLTDSLEFVFAASDLIEAGWDAAQWSGEPHGTGHSFARFRWGYKETVALLKQAMEPKD